MLFVKQILEFILSITARLRHESMISLLRTFFSSRPSRNQLQSKGILKQRVFACDLGEHLSNSQQDGTNSSSF